MHAGPDSVAAASHGSTTSADMLDSLQPIDLTVSCGTLHQRLPPVRRYWQKRTVRRNKVKLQDTEQFIEKERNEENMMDADTPEFTFISGPQYLFQRFIRQYPVAALAVWTALFLVEMALVVVYIVQTTRNEMPTWVYYDLRAYSNFFYVQVALSLISLLQLLFAYSLSVMTIIVVVSTSIYQCIIFFIALAPSLAWVSRLYVPFFLRCWPMRQYFLFVLDSIALMMTRNQKLDLLRLGMSTLTFFMCLVFTAASLFQIDQSFNGAYLNLGVAIYFTITTITTVGFGDVTPKTADGKALTIVIIFIFLAKMPTFIQVIRSTVKILRALRSYQGRRKHFIVFGRVTREEAVSILDEVFCLYPMKTVCFCNKAFDPDVVAIGRHPTYRLRATFLTMNTLDAFSLGRMEAGHAAAVIIFPVNEGFSSRVDDDVMLSSLIFERLVPQLPQYLWLRYGLHAHLLRGQQATVVDEHWKKYITATALLLPGIVPFLVNLVRTAWAESDEPPTLWSDEGIDDWKSLYEYSRRNVISTCSVPLRFAKTSLRDIVMQFKYTGVLIVGVEEYARKLMRLDLDYIVEEEDVLLAVYERSHNSLAVALELFAQVGPLEHNVMPQHGTHFWQTMGDAHMQSESLNSSVVFYPFHPSADVTTNYGGAAQPPGDDQPRIADGASAAEIKRELSAQPFVEQHPHGVPLSNLIFSAANTHSLNNLIWRLKVASNGDYSAEIERSAIVTNLQDQINATLDKMAQEYLAIVTEREQLFIDAEGKDDIFLFVDQTVSILRKSSTSVYEDIISQTIAQYELYVMMQCIRSVHVQSTLTLLTLRKYPPEFLKVWKDIFGTPLRYLLGQGSLDSHLNYALNSAASASKIRGVLLYCSQMGPRDFGDVPLFSVENSVRDLLVWNEQYADVELTPEHNIMVELQSFTSSIKVAPFHSNSEWRRRGEINFQDSLAFMMGHCFSSNMIQTLMVHCHRDSRISRFFEMTLNISSTAEMFDVSEWKGPVPQSKTLFKLCDNQALQFQSYGDAFEFLISKKNSIAIGVFRLFPDSENLNGRPRYFVTNPPLAMPLLVEDIIYCLDGRDAPFGRLRKT